MKMKQIADRFIFNQRIRLNPRRRTDKPGNDAGNSPKQCGWFRPRELKHEFLRFLPALPWLRVSVGRFPLCNGPRSSRPSLRVTNTGCTAVTDDHHAGKWHALWTFPWRTGECRYCSERTRCLVETTSDVSPHDTAPPAKPPSAAREERTDTTSYRYA